MTGSAAVGFTCCLVAGVGFGSNYLPVKKVKVGDGMFFSACMTVGILLVGVVVNFTIACDEYSLAPHKPPQFEPLAAIGGAVWMVGNLLCPLIIEWLGLGLGLAIWDCFNLLTGWATGSFGLFGVWQEDMPHPAMNYAGVAMACASLVFLAFAGDEAELQGEVEQQGEADERKLDGMESQVSEAPGAPAAAASSTGAEASEAPGKPTLVRSSTLPSVNTVSTTGSSQSSEECLCDQCQGGAEQDEPASDLETGDAGSAAASPAEEPPRLGQICEMATECDSQARVSSQQSSPTVCKTELGSAIAAEGRWAWSYLLSAPRTRQATGFVLSMVAGTCFGLTFDLPTDLMQQGKTVGSHSTNPMDYVFSHFCGISITAFVALLAYFAVRRGESYTPRSVVAPAIASGVMWGVAQVAWFQANVELSMVVAFPVISTLPGIVGMVWGYCLFGEFRTKRSQCLAAAGMCIRIPAVILIALSGL